MKEPVVADSACLIGLERINHLEVLPSLFDPILVPPEVQREFGVSLPWLKVEAPVGQALVAVLKMLVDDGEAEAIALAQERGCKVILDDRQARSVAGNLGVPLIGTIGILVRAKQHKIIPALKPLLVDLESDSFYVGEELKKEALRLADE